MLACVGDSVDLVCGSDGVDCELSDIVLLVPDRELEEAEAGVGNISKSFIYRRLI